MDFIYVAAVKCLGRRKKLREASWATILSPAHTTVFLFRRTKSNRRKAEDKCLYHNISIVSLFIAPELLRFCLEIRYSLGKRDFIIVYKDYFHNHEHKSFYSLSFIHSRSLVSLYLVFSLWLLSLLLPQLLGIKYIDSVKTLQTDYYATH